MRVDEFYVDERFNGGRHLDHGLLTALRRGPIDGLEDIEVAVPLARLAHEELELFGTSGTQTLNNGEMRTVLLSLRAVVERLGITGFEPTFRDFATFKNYWVRKGAFGSWQARRNLLAELFEPLHDTLADLEGRALSSTLALPVSPHPRTGLAKVDEEISELRRHFLSARTPQDYRNVGTDCVAVTESLSRELYDPSRHLREGEALPPVDKTKQRLGRVIEDAAPGSDNATLRKLALAAIEMAQQVKHSTTPTQHEAGIAADSVILLAHILQRLAEPAT